MEDLDTSVRHLNIVSYADGMLLYFEALERPSSDSQAILRLLSLAREHLEDSLRQMSGNYLTYIQLAAVLQMHSKYLSRSQYQEIEQYRSKANDLLTKVYGLNRIEPSLRALAAARIARNIYLSAKSISKNQLKLDEATSYCEKSLELDPNSIEAYVTWVFFNLFSSNLISQSFSL